MKRRDNVLEEWAIRRNGHAQTPQTEKQLENLIQTIPAVKRRDNQQKGFMANKATVPLETKDKYILKEP